MFAATILQQMLIKQPAVSQLAPILSEHETNYLNYLEPSTVHTAKAVAANTRSTQLRNQIRSPKKKPQKNQLSNTTP